MNLFDYLDNRNRRRIILRQLRYWRKERLKNANAIHLIPESHMKVFLQESLNDENQIKYYIDKLNKLI